MHTPPISEMTHTKFLLSTVSVKEDNGTQARGEIENSSNVLLCVYMNKMERVREREEK